MQIESTPHMYIECIYICPSYLIIPHSKYFITYGKEEDSELSELEILLYEEPRGKGSEDDTDEGHTVGRDIFCHPGMVNSQVGQGLVNELYRVEININLRSEKFGPGPPTWTTFSNISCFTVMGLKGEYAYEEIVVRFGWRTGSFCSSR